MGQRTLACCLASAGVAGNLAIRPRQNSVGPAPTAALPPSRHQRCVQTNLSSREEDEFVNCRAGIEGAVKHPVDLRHVETGEHGVVPVGQRPAATPMTLLRSPHRVALQVGIWRLPILDLITRVSIQATRS